MVERFNRVLIQALRARWPGFTIGLIPNPRLHKSAAPLLAQAKEWRAASGEKVRLVGETPYQAESWSRERRVVYKAEALDQGPNTRFVVTTRADPPEPSTTGTSIAARPHSGSRTSSAPASPIA